MLRRENLLLIAVIITLGIIPFFWMGRGEVDIGGDASRLYFIDPLSYLVNFSLFFISPQGTGNAEPNFFSIPFLILLIVLKQILISPYLLVSLFNSFKLIAAFFSVFLIINEFLVNIKLKKTTVFYSSLIGGLFYILTPTMTGNWDRALLSHNQVFVNPLIFLLLLKFVNTGRDKFLWFLLFTTFIFSNSFAYTSAPPFFAFFPLAIIFLFIYSIISRKKIKYKKLFFAFLLFLGLQSFHLIPQIINFLDPGSYTNTRFFDKEAIVQEGVRYFDSILAISRLSNYVLLSYGQIYQPIVTPLYLFVVLIGLIFAKKLKNLILLTAFFYLVILFLLSGKITDLGSDFYRSLFYLPGFSMFRNFIGQWLFVFSFFSSLLLGFSFSSIVERLSLRKTVILTVLFAGTLVITSWYFITGDMVNRILFQKSKTRISQTLDNDFIKTLSYIENIPTDSKILVLPLTDAYYQVIQGKENKGVYIGPSAFSYLGGKKDFVGYQILSPFSDDFLQLVKNDRFDQINELLGMLNIHYIVHNSSDFALDKNNEDFLYSHVRMFMPNTQSDYEKFINALDSDLVAEFGSYKIYRLANIKKYRHIYSSNTLIMTEQEASISSVLNEMKLVNRNIFIFTDKCEELGCVKSNPSIPEIKFQKISPVEYKVYVEKVSSDYFLVFSEAFHKDWKAYIKEEDQKNIADMIDEKEVVHNSNYFKSISLNAFHEKSVGENQHFIANYYANGWLVTPEDANYNSKYVITLKLRLQELFYFSSILSIFSLVILFIWGYNIIRQDK